MVLDFVNLRYELVLARDLSIIIKVITERLSYFFYI